MPLPRPSLHPQSLPVLLHQPLRIHPAELVSLSVFLVLSTLPSCHFEPFSFCPTICVPWSLPVYPLRPCLPLSSFGSSLSRFFHLAIFALLCLFPSLATPLVPPCPLCTLLFISFHPCFSCGSSICWTLVLKLERVFFLSVEKGEFDWKGGGVCGGECGGRTPFVVRPICMD